MIPTLIRIFGIASGILLTTLGVVGLFLPFLQGIIFLVLGIYLIAKFSPAFREYIKRFKGRHHRIDSALEYIETHLSKETRQK